MNPVPDPVHDTITSFGLAPGTAQITVDVGVHATTLPLMTGALFTVSLLAVALLSGALPPVALPLHAARTVTAPARRDAATVHLPARPRSTCLNRASTMCPFLSRMRLLDAQVRPTVARLALLGGAHYRVNAVFSPHATGLTVADPNTRTPPRRLPAASRRRRRRRRLCIACPTGRRCFPRRRPGCRPDLQTNEGRRPQQRLDRASGRGWTRPNCAWP
jgi:hypothetical protein